MKKKLTAAALVLCLALVLGACSKGNANVITGYKSGDVTLGQYKGVEYSPLSTEVTDEDIQKKIDSFLNNNKEKVEITDRTDVQSGDVANINFTGYMNDETFEGGTGENYDLTIGTGQFIEGFEDGLIGVNKGETVDLNLKFPDPYQNNPDFSGKDVKFTVTVNGIYTMVTPEFTDELVADKTDYNTTAEYRDYVASQLKTQLESDAQSSKEYDIVKKVIENSTFKKDLTDEITEAKNNMISSYNSMYQSAYGVDAATFFAAIYGMDAATFDEYMKNQAEMNTKFGYVASAVAEQEKIECTEDEIAELAKNMLDSYGYQSIEELYAQLKSVYKTEGKDVVAAQVKLNKAADIMYDNAVAVAEASE
jgi:trigger factor